MTDFDWTLMPANMDYYRRSDVDKLVIEAKKEIHSLQDRLKEADRLLMKYYPCYDKANCIWCSGEWEKINSDLSDLDEVIHKKDAYIDELRLEIYRLSEDLFVYESFKLELVDFILPTLERANVFQSVPNGESKMVKMITEQEIEALIDKKLSKIGKPKIIAAIQDVVRVLRGEDKGGGR